MAVDNKFMGQFELVGVPPAPRGVPQIEVSFDIDANGIMKVSAKDQATGKDQSMVIQPSGGLNKTEIDNMIKNAEKYRGEDQKKREMIEIKNNLDSKIHTTEKVLSENKGSLSQEIIDTVEASLKAGKDALAGSDNDQIKSAYEKLEKDSLSMGNYMYQNKGSSGQQQENQEQQSQEENKEENKEESKEDKK